MPDEILPWSGERYIPGMPGVIALEHWHRYRLASELVGSLRVLDLACGEGYGSNLLSRAAESVVGVDISSLAVKHACEKYSSHNLFFIVADCGRLPFPDGYFDVVISFETIEHHVSHDEMLSEVRRVLCPSGFMVISTPDVSGYSESGSVDNEFHLLELSAIQFVELISRHFPFYEMYGQRSIGVSLVAGLELVGEVLQFPCKQSEFELSDLQRPVYLIAVAGLGSIPRLPVGIYEGANLESTVDPDSIGNGAKAKLYWSSAVGGGYSERQSLVRQYLADGRRCELTFRIAPDNIDLSMIRFDPAEFSSIIGFHGFEISFADNLRTDLIAWDSALIKYIGLQSLSCLDTPVALWLSKGRDPQVILNLCSVPGIEQSSCILIKVIFSAVAKPDFV